MRDQQYILVVDDHEPLLWAMRDFLEAEGYVVFVAADGEQALAVMDRVLPHLIISDMMMPNLDGYAFLKEIRARREWFPIPFVLMTARDDLADCIQNKGTSATDYLDKPFAFSDLMVIVHRHLFNGHVSG